MPFWIRSKREQQIRAMIEDPEVDLSVKFTGVLAILAQLQFPIQLSDFRSAIPLHFWSSQVQFHYTSMLGGSVPIFTEFGKEWFYRMNVGKARTHYGSHVVWFAASKDLLPTEGPGGGTFEPRLDTPVARFALCHPFLRDELHDPEGIYLFK